MSVPAVVVATGIIGELYHPTTRSALALSAVGLVGLSTYLPIWAGVLAVLTAFVCTILIVFASSNELSWLLTNEHLDTLDYTHLIASAVLAVSSVFAVGGLYVLLSKITGTPKSKMSAITKRVGEKYSLVGGVIMFAILLSMPIVSLRVIVESLKPTAKLIQAI